MSDCIFCKIAEHSIPAKIVFENNDVLAFRDLNPQAPVHVLVIPKKHVTSLNDLTETSLMAALLTAAQQVALQEKIAESGYRTVINCNPEGGQSVYHLHLHVLGGKQLGGSMVGLHP